MKKVIKIEEFVGTQKSDTQKELSQELLESELPIFQDKMKYQNQQMMLVLSDIVKSTELDPVYMLDPIKYLDERNIFSFKRGEIAPGMELTNDGYRELILSLRKKYIEDGEMPPEVLSVHSTTSTQSYVREDRRTSFTFEKSNITGTERRAITSSETRTSTVTSGRELLEFNLRRALVDPEILTNEGE